MAACSYSPAHAQLLHDPWVRTDRSVDCRSRETILADIIKPGQTDEQKAVAVWRFMVDHTWHFSRADCGVPLRLFNVYGYSLCGTLSRMQNWLRAGVFPPSYIAAGGCSRYGTSNADRRAICRGWLIDSWTRLDAHQDRPGPGNLGHSMGEVFYDGHWHFLDPHSGFFVYTADGSRIVGYRDLQTDPTLVSDPVKTSDPFMPHDGGKPLFFYRVSGSGGSGIPDPNAKPKSDRAARPEPSMAVTLRPGERFIRSWHGIGGAFKRSRSWKGQWNKQYIDDGPRHVPSGPNTWRRYANGRFIYEAPLEKPAAAKAGFAVMDNAAFGPGDGKAPLLRPADPARPMRLAIDLDSPYVLIRGKLTGELVVPDGGAASVAVKLDRGKETVVWQGKQTGLVPLDVTFDKELDYRYSYRLTLSVAGRGGGVRALRLETIVQLNPLTLPRLRPGKNTVTVTCAKPAELTGADSPAGPLTVTYAWGEKSGQRTHTQKITRSPQAYTIDVGEVTAAEERDPSYMRHLELFWPAR